MLIFTSITLCVGTAYFVFGENLNVYDDSDVTQREFMSAGLKFIEQLTQVSPFPIYKFFPTKSYRELVKTIGRMRELGLFSLCSILFKAHNIIVYT